MPVRLVADMQTTLARIDLRGGLESVCIAAKGYACMLSFDLDPLWVGYISVDPDRTRFMQAGGERESIA